MSTDFKTTLDQIHWTARSTAEQGALFERLMLRYFRQEPLYADQSPHIVAPGGARRS